jgi:hypothetical protein
MHIHMHVCTLKNTGAILLQFATIFIESVRDKLTPISCAPTLLCTYPELCVQA